MSQELGRFEKPEADRYKAERKIYLVPLIFSPQQPGPEYGEMYDRYWSGVLEHLLKLESSLGSITHIYHEAVGLEQDEGMAAIAMLNENSAAVARSKVEGGAKLEALEDQELVAENLDWQRCLLIGLESRKATETIWANYSEGLKQRYEAMGKKIDETLQPGEAGLLFVNEDHRIQFPGDVRVFFVSPPALDEIHRWLRDQRGKRG